MRLHLSWQVLLAAAGSGTLVAGAGAASLPLAWQLTVCDSLQQGSTAPPCCVRTRKVFTWTIREQTDNWLPSCVPSREVPPKPWAPAALPGLVVAGWDGAGSWTATP